jgi:hypothetical protein
MKGRQLEGGLFFVSATVVGLCVVRAVAAT